MHGCAHVNAVLDPTTKFLAMAGARRPTPAAPLTVRLWIPTWAGGRRTTVAPALSPRMAARSTARVPTASQRPTARVPIASQRHRHPTTARVPMARVPTVRTRSRRHGTPTTMPRDNRVSRSTDSSTRAGRIELLKARRLVFATGRLAFRSAPTRAPETQGKCVQAVLQGKCVQAVLQGKCVVTLLPSRSDDWLPREHASAAFLPSPQRHPALAPHL